MRTKAKQLKQLAGGLTHDDVNKTVGSNIRLMRLYSEMSLADAGRQTGYTLQAISRIEKGEVPAKVGTLDRFAKIFNCSVSSFFEGLSETGTGSNAVAITSEMGLVRRFINSEEGIELNTLVKSLPHHRRKTIIALAKELGQ